MFLLVLAGKDWESNEELVKDAAQGPHVDGGRVADTHHDLGRAIKTRLNVGVKLVLLVGARPEVDDFYATLVALSQQDILGLHVAVHDAELFHVVQGDEDLNRKSTNQALRNALKVVHLDELVEVHGEHLEGED